MKRLLLLVLLATWFLATSRLASGLDGDKKTQAHRGAAYVPGELLVKYKPSVRAAASEYYRSRWGVSALETFRRIGVQYVKLPEGMSVQEALKIYQNDPDVEYAEPNYYRYATVTPNDTYFGLLWGLHNMGQDVDGTSGTADADLDAPEAWDITTGSGSVVVALIDTGVDYTHPDLLDNIWINADEDIGDANGDGFPGNKGIDDDGDGLIDEDSEGRQPGEAGYTNDLKDDDDENGHVDDIRGWDFVDDHNDPMDMGPNGHGTHVSGTIGAVGNNSIGVIGVSWRAKIMVLRSLDTSGMGDVEDITRAMEYANAKGAHVINMSFGGAGFSQTEKDAIDASSALVVCAAGNDGTDNDISPLYPASYTSSNIIAVAATDQDDNLALFSNYGSTSVDVAAPGTNIYSCEPGTGYQYMDGTSVAAPHVAGLAALIKAQYPSITNVGIKAVIEGTVDARASLSGKVVTGGRVNAYNMFPLRAPSPRASHVESGGCFIASAALE